MKIAPQPIQKPKPPAAPAGATELAVNYLGPQTVDKEIGKIPADTFSALFVDTGTPTEPVVRAQPVVDGVGTPVWQEKVANLDLHPYSPVKKALVGGAIGAGVLGTVGAVVGYFTGNVALGLSLGLGAGALGGGGLGAARVMGDKVTPDWELKPVVRHEMHGYSDAAVPQTMTIGSGKNATTITTGYWHYYSANVKEVPVDGYQFWAPVARHSSDS